MIRHPLECLDQRRMIPVRTPMGRAPVEQLLAGRGIGLAQLKGSGIGQREIEILLVQR